MGSGKTTLAHRLAGSVGCPAICRDEIKERMVHTTSGFVARPRGRRGRAMTGLGLRVDSVPGGYLHGAVPGRAAQDNLSE